MPSARCASGPISMPVTHPHATTTESPTTIKAMGSKQGTLVDFPRSFEKWGGDDGHRNGVLCADRDVTRGCYVVCSQRFDRLRAPRGQTAQAHHFLDGPQGEADQ